MTANHFETIRTLGKIPTPRTVSFDAAPTPSFTAPDPSPTSMASNNPFAILSDDDDDNSISNLPQDFNQAVATTPTTLYKINKKNKKTPRLIISVMIISTHCRRRHMNQH